MAFVRLAPSADFLCQTTSIEFGPAVAAILDLKIAFPTQAIDIGSNQVYAV